LHARFAQVVHRLENLRFRLSEAEHDPALVTISGAISFMRRKTSSERRYFARDRTSGVSRSTVSTL